MSANATRSDDPTDQVVTKLSPWSVAETVTRLSDLVAAKGLKLFAVIDHSGEAKANGLELRDTKVLIFGSPQAGTPVMQAAPLAALDLPLKVLVWADGNQSKLSYTAPAALAARYDLSDELAARLSGIDALTNTLLDQEHPNRSIRPRQRPGESRAKRVLRPYAGMQPHDYPTDTGMDNHRPQHRQPAPRGLQQARTCDATGALVDPATTPT